MGDFFSKFENFLFDILGLILPGFIFLLLFSAPLMLFNFESVTIGSQEQSGLLSGLSVLSKTLHEYTNSNINYVLIVICVASYIIGHLLKVFSIIQYEIFGSLFDQTINKLISFIYLWIIKAIINIYNKIFKRDLTQEFLYMQVRILFIPVKNTLNKIFVFKPKDYMKENEKLKKLSIEILSQKFNVPLTSDWDYTMYKISTVLFAQENVKSLSGFFLAKYNLYRSLAFAFAVSCIYFNIFYNVTEEFLDGNVKILKVFILTLFALLWFTFHYKYKRYWTLCGNETLVSFYYFLNKNKLV